MSRRLPTRALLVAVLAFALPCVRAQHRPMDVPDVVTPSTPARTRLILKDGTYQLVLDYKVVGSVVRYRSAERNGAPEDIPLALVDLPATQKWARDHTPGVASGDQHPVLSPELAREEAARTARTPEVAPDLRLPEEDSVLVLDTFHGAPELVPLPQQGSDLNKETAHAVQKMAINPSSSPHRLLDVPSGSADVQVHVPDPVFYVRLGKDDEADTGGAFIVDTGEHPPAGREVPAGSSESSDYIIERLDARRDSRILDSFRIAWLGSQPGSQRGSKPQPDVIELREEPLPGGHWLKLTAQTPLDFGEYALVEVLNGREINADVWDFGVHSAAPENLEALHPEPKRPASLERRKP